MQNAMKFPFNPNVRMHIQSLMSVHTNQAHSCASPPSLAFVLEFTQTKWRGNSIHVTNVAFFSLKKPSATGHPGEHCFIIHYELYRNSHVLPVCVFLCVCLWVCTVCPAVSGWIIHCGVMMKQLDYRPCECFSAQSASPYTLSQPEYCRIHLFSSKEEACSDLTM